jgi:regulator of replication initiation timing
MREGLVMDEKLEELQKEIARLSVEVEMLKAKMRVCIETVARLREELERLKRRARRPSLREYIEALRAYDEVEAGEPEPP